MSISASEPFNSVKGKVLFALIVSKDKEYPRAMWCRYATEEYPLFDIWQKTRNFTLHGEPAFDDL